MIGVGLDVTHILDKGKMCGKTMSDPQVVTLMKDIVDIGPWLRLFDQDRPLRNSFLSQRPKSYMKLVDL